MSITADQSQQTIALKFTLSICKFVDNESRKKKLLEEVEPEEVEPVFKNKTIMIDW